MWIKCGNKNLEEIFFKGFMDEPLEFSENGKAQTTKTVGKKLVDKVGAIKPVEEEKEEKDKEEKEKAEPIKKNQYKTTNEGDQE